MSPKTKKLIYGIFYLAVLFLVGSWLYNAFLKPASTCFDKKQNQGETGVDCGGPCVPCAVLRLESLQAGDVKIFSVSSGRVFLVGEVLNPNSNYGAETFSYKFNIYGVLDRPLETVLGTDFIYAGQKKYILSSDVKSSVQEIGRVTLEFENPVWRATQDFKEPNLSYRELVTEVGPKSLKISGLAANNSPFDLGEVDVVGIIFDKAGNELFMAQTKIYDLKSFEESNFSVSFRLSRIWFQRLTKGQAGFSSTVINSWLLNGEILIGCFWAAFYFWVPLVLFLWPVLILFFSGGSLFGMVSPL